MSSRLGVLIVSAVLLAALPSLSSAQNAEDGAGQGAPSGQGTESENSAPLTRPFRGLFGLGDEGRTGVNLSGSLFGAYDDNLGATLPTQPLDPRYQQSGWYTGAEARLSVNWRGERSSLSGYGSAATSYYFDTAEPIVPRYSGGIGFSRPLGERNAFHVSQTIVYAPSFLNDFFAPGLSLDERPVAPVDLDPGMLVGGEMIAHYSTATSISRRLSRQATVSASYLYSFANYADFDRQYDEHRASVGFRRQLTRHAALRLGYGYRTANTQLRDFDVPEAPYDDDIHSLDFGIDYSRALTLSMSRRTTVSFSTGSAFLSGRSTRAGGFPAETRNRFFVTGRAQLAHEMGRTWQAAVVYARTASFSDFLFEPVMSDSVTATLAGLIGRRNEVSLRASASRGIVMSTSDEDFSSAFASVQWRRALGRFVAAQVSYLYYDHDFANAVRLPRGFPQSLDRQGVRFGLTVWLPLH